MMKPGLLKFYLTIFFIGLVSVSQAQTEGKVLENKEIQSTILGKPVKYSVYLPEDYETSQRNYPVVYLLHGLEQNSSTWLEEGEIKSYVDNAIKNGTIPPMILIMPDAERTWYINSFDGKVLYEDFFIKELIPGVEKIFRIRSEKKYRGIAGVSMGGYGTFYYSLKYPDLFSAAAPLSAAVRNDSAFMKLTDEVYADRFAKVLGPVPSGGNRFTTFYRAHSIIDIVKNTQGSELSKVRYWIDCGDDDPLVEGNCIVHLMLTDKKVTNEFRVRDGAHNYIYWRSGIIDALKYIGDSFR
ncbi:MAG: alpha/beta hydrolase-fold protein [Bacteroidales bacterium]